MAEALEQWIERQLRVVDDDGRSCASIELRAGQGGVIWDRWDSPLRKEDGGPGPVALAALIDEVIDAAQEDWPAKQAITVMLIALDKQANDRGRWTKTVKGKNSNANQGMMASESVQHAHAMAAHVETTQTLLKASNTQVALMMQINQTLAENWQRTLAMFVEQKLQHSLEVDKEDQQLKAEMWSTAKQLGPDLVQLLVHAATTKKT